MAEQTEEGDQNAFDGTWNCVGVGGCGMQNCGGYEAKSIVYTSSLDPKASADESNCTVQQ